MIAPPLPGATAAGDPLPIDLYAPFGDHAPGGVIGRRKHLAAA